MQRHAGSVILSIITPTLNASAHVRACAESSLGQVGDFEHIFVDGGSTDGTLEIIESHKSSRIKTIIENGSGIYAAQNIGINSCSGNWLYFIGADDALVEDSIIGFIDFLMNCDSDYARVQIRLNNGPKHFSALQQSWVYRKSVIQAIGGFTGPGLAELPVNEMLRRPVEARFPNAICMVASGGASWTKGSSVDVVTQS